MKKELAILCLSALAFATLQQPALADFSLTFGHHDRNHDGRWNYREFNDANHLYYRHHPGVAVLSQRDMRRDFDRLDTDHDGYVNMQEVKTYRTWD